MHCRRPCSSNTPPWQLELLPKKSLFSVVPHRVPIIWATVHRATSLNLRKKHRLLRSQQRIRKDVPQGLNSMCAEPRMEDLIPSHVIGSGPVRKEVFVPTQTESGLAGARL
jgi:hypothetical protein